MPASLWTPTGERPLQEKDIIKVLDPMERSVFARMSDIAQKYNISLVCKRCDSAIMGQNNGTELVPTVACNCREWRFVA